MNALVLDAGALVAIDRDDRAMLDRIQVATEKGQEVRTNAMVLAQVWRDGRGRQATVAMLAQPGDNIYTSDPNDLRRLCEAAGIEASVIRC